MAEERQRFAEIKELIGGITQRYRSHLRGLHAELEDELAPYQKELDSIRDITEAEIEAMDVELGSRPVGHAEPNDAGWMFRSDRSYEDQLRYYPKTANSA
jgi:hypothetical protein